MFPKATFLLRLITQLWIVFEILSKIVKNGFFFKFLFSTVTWPKVKTTQGHIILKVSPQATFWPNIITLLWIVSEILSMLKFGTDGLTDRQTDARGSLHRPTLFTHVSQKKLKPFCVSYCLSKGSPLSPFKLFPQKIHFFCGKLECAAPGVPTIGGWCVGAGDGGVAVAANINHSSSSVFQKFIWLCVYHLLDSCCPKPCSMTMESLLQFDLAGCMLSVYV